MRYLLLPFFLVFSTCTQQKEVLEPVTFPTVSPTLAVYCLLTPGDSILASLTPLRSVSDRLPVTPLGDLVYPRLPGAKVSLENLTTSQVILLDYLGIEGRYGAKQFSGFNITPGHTYGLSVSMAGFPALSATCRMPEKAAGIEQFSYGEPYSDGFSSRRRVEIRWQDVGSILAPVNYFLATSYQLSASASDRATSVFYNKYITQIGHTYFYQNDALNNPYTRSFQLITTSREVFKFYKMAENMISITQTGTADIFGAYQGIVPEYTNVTGGYGIVGGYLSTQLVTTFK